MELKSAWISIIKWRTSYRERMAPLFDSEDRQEVGRKALQVHDPILAHDSSPQVS